MQVCMSLSLSLVSMRLCARFCAYRRSARLLKEREKEMKDGFLLRLSWNRLILSSLFSRFSTFLSYSSSSILLLSGLFRFSFAMVAASSCYAYLDFRPCHHYNNNNHIALSSLFGSNTVSLNRNQSRLNRATSSGITFFNENLKSLVFLHFLIIYGYRLQVDKLCFLCLMFFFMFPYYTSLILVPCCYEFLLLASWWNLEVKLEFIIIIIIIRCDEG